MFTECEGASINHDPVPARRDIDSALTESLASMKWAAICCESFES
jgi:hypothetical protein